MEGAGRKDDCEQASRRSLSPSKDDSLTDFKSPKLEPPAPIRARIIIDKKTKKSSSKGKTCGKKKKETVVKEIAQPSIESSFFKAAFNGKTDGHTCPLCMKYFADTSAGTSHTKSCAAKNKVSTKKLLAAVALQERQSNERVAIGLPAGPIVQPKDKTPRRPREAVAKGDPDLQLALALSKSLSENQLEQELEEALFLAAEHRGDGQLVGFSSDIESRKTLTNFGFLTNKPAGISEGPPTRTKRKKHLGPTILQTRSQEARDRLLTERVAEILMGNEAITQVCREETKFAVVEPVKEQRVTLTSRLLREIHRTTKRVWDVARMPTKITDFYVDDLAPVIVPADCQQQQQQENSENLAKELKSNVEENCENKMNASSIPPAESRRLEENMKEREKMSESCEEHESINEGAKDRLKIPSPNSIHITDRQYRNTLPMDWRNTLNVSSMSDVIVLVENGHIWAHKLVFYVRCSDILLDCETNYDAKFSHVKEKICWPRVDLSTGLAFLEFVYSGLIENNISVFSDNNVTIGVRRLARKYKVKALFDYLRRKQAEFDKVNNVSEQVESRKFSGGLCSPVVIDVNETPSDALEIIEENLAENYERKDAEDQKSGLCSPIVIQVGITPGHVGQDRGESSESSPSRYNNDNFSSTETNAKILIKKTAKGNLLHSQDTDSMSVISIASSRSRTSMSPDLFDETTEQVSVDSAKNSESSEIDEKNPDLSDNENSNLKILADLIGQNDFSPSSDVIRQSAASSTITQDKTDEKSLCIDEISKFSSPTTQHAEPRKSSDNFIHESRTKIKDRSRSQLFPEKQKSNLSLFIAKIQKMNAKGPLDSYTEEESMAEQPAQIRPRIRNPFNVNNLTDKSILDCSETNLSSKLGRGRHGKRGLSVFDKLMESISPKKVDPNETTASDDSVDANKNAQAEKYKSCDVDDTLDTDDEDDTSMYSKYRKTNKHNNSISYYRNMLKKLGNDNKNDSFMSPVEKAIDLTQESDYSDTDVPPPPPPPSSSPGPLSGTSPLSERKIADDTSGDSDSIHSAATAIAHYNNSDAEPEKATYGVVFSDKRTNNHGVTKATNYSQISDTGSEKSSDSDDASTESPSSKKTNNKDKSKDLRSNENLKRKKQNAPLNSIDISAKGVECLSNSSRHSNYDLLEGDDEIFARSWKSRTPSPLFENSSAPPTGSFSSGRKRKSVVIETKYDNFNKNKLDDDEDDVKSSKGTKSPRISPEYSDLDVFEIDEEMFAQSLKKARVLHQSPSPSAKCNFHYSDNSISSRGNRRVENTSFDQDLGTKNLTNSTEYPDIDVDDLITQNLRENGETFRRSLTPLGTRSSDYCEKTASHLRRRRCSNGERGKTPEICIDDFGPNKSDKSSEGRKSLRNSPDYHYEIFEPDDRVFTQSFSLPRTQSPCRTFTPLPNCTCTSKNNNPRSTLKSPSPIVITSSPEFDIDAEINFSSHEQDAASNKENLFAIDRNSPRKSYDNLAQVISPTNLESSARFIQDYVENPVERVITTSNLERPMSPQPSTSWKSSGNHGASTNSAKTPLVRWNSMPATSSSSSHVGCKRSRTPKQSSRLVMSQDVTPPVNYDIMGTPELKKELSKYGIKPQSRTRARKLLTHIYNELHPLVSVSPVENKSSNHIALSDEDEPPAKIIGNRTSEDSDYSDREIPLSQERGTRAANIIPEEMDFAGGGGGNTSPEDSEQTSIGSIKKAFNALLKEDKEMHIKVLTYEPLPLELLYLMLKTGGLKCKCKDLMDFLDEECITFQVQSQRNNARSRGKKTARGRKGNMNTQRN